MAQPPLLRVSSLTPAFDLARADDASAFVSGAADADTDNNILSKPWSALSFEMHEGDVLIVRGPSGCGKTTLLKCLADLLLYEGEVRFLGHLPTSPTITPALFRSRIQYVPQRPPLYAGTPSELFKYVQTFEANRKPQPVAPEVCAKRERDEEALLNDATAPLSKSGFGWTLSEPLKGTQEGQASQNSSTPVDTGDALPVGPDPLSFSSADWALPTRVWSTEWATLSGGEVQRCSLAIALALKVRQENQGVLLLDEPTSALDASSCQAIERTLLTRCSPPLTLVWITHNDEQMERVTRIVGEENRRAVVRPGGREREVRVLRLGLR